MSHNALTEMIFKRVAVTSNRGKEYEIPVYPYFLVHSTLTLSPRGSLPLQAHVLEATRTKTMIIGAGCLLVSPRSQVDH